MISKGRAVKFAIIFLFICMSGFLSAGPLVSVKSDGPVTLNGSANRDKAINLVRHYVIEHKMTKLKDICLDYILDDDSDADNYMVAVRGNSRYNMCGGDPGVSAALFYFQVNRKTWQLSTNADSTDGTFTPVK